MIQLSIPGLLEHQLEHLVLDYNGTLAIDGNLIPGVRPKLRLLAKKLRIHVVTADTFGTAARQLQGLPCKLTILGPNGQDVAKSRYVTALGKKSAVCIGNGRNDRRMLHTAALGIAVLQEEGAAFETLAHADVVCRTILDAFELLEKPKRLRATLRS